MTNKNRIYKSLILKNIADETKVSHTVVTMVLDKFLDHVKSSLIEDKDVIIFGFGTFKSSMLKKRMGYNPSTAKKEPLDATKVVTFKSSSSLRLELKNSLK